MRRLISLLIIAVFALSVAQATTSPTTVSGSFTFTGNITVHETVSGSEMVYCSVTLSEDLDANGRNSETVTTQATLSSGNLYTCAPTINYTWHLDTPTTDTVAIQVTVGIGPSGAANLSDFTRTGYHLLPSVTGVPASGSSWGRAMGTAL